MLAEDIAYFVEIAKQGSLGKAATKLGVSQPALTKSIHRLERRLQTALFRRTPGGVALTPIGEAFYERARIVGSALHEALREVRDLRLGIAGEVRLGLSPAVPFALISQAHERFMRASPGAILRVSCAPTHELARSLGMGELDLVLGMQLQEPEQEIRHQYEKLYADDLQLAVNASHPLLSEKNLAPQAMLKYPWVMPPTFVRGWVESAFRALQLQPPVPVLEIYLVDHIMTMVATTRTEVLAVVPGRTIAQYVKYLPVRALSFPPGFKTNIEFGTYSRRGGYLSPTAGKFLAVMRACARTI